MDSEHYHCDDCEEADCESCGHSFYAEEDAEFEVECPCCGSHNVQP